MPLLDLVRAVMASGASCEAPTTTVPHGPLRPNDLNDLSPPPTPREAVPDRSVWRSILATWSIPERHRWGELANAYEDGGMTWDEAEWRAFRDLTQEDRHDG